MAEEHGRRQRGEAFNRCYVVCVGERDSAPSGGQVSEILSLVRAQGDEVVGHQVVVLDRKDPRTLVGRGACEALAENADALGADMLVVDAELSPSQARNLEDATGFAVCDREAVILNVFLRHARTRRARIQVGIAQLQYLRPRIRGLGLTMDQQAGGIMRARGPGETASELMARRLDSRLAQLQRAFSRLRRTGETQRKGRRSTKTIALLGYTNAGKTTLMNALTSAGLSARDMPFETLDTTSRCLTRHGGDVLLSDTVGFIRRLPERLLASFESTLAEIKDASVLALVIDSSDPEWEMHLDTTEALIDKLDATNVPRFHVFNKVDRLPKPLPERALLRASRGHPFMQLSAHDEEEAAALRSKLVQYARASHRRARVFVSYSATHISAMIYANCRVLHVVPSERGARFTIEAERHIVEQVKQAARRVGA